MIKEGRTPESFRIQVVSAHMYLHTAAITATEAGRTHEQRGRPTLWLAWKVVEPIRVMSPQETLL